MAKRFSKWAKWNQRNDLEKIHLPGVYAISYSKINIEGGVFSWSPVIYIGMTNAKGGLKSRLQQFDYTIKGGNVHGGASRVRYKYPDYNKLVRQLYVSTCPFECDVSSNKPPDLRIMGDIAKREYECLATFVEEFDKLPEFNDKKRSPKK